VSELQNQQEGVIKSYDDNGNGSWNVTCHQTYASTKIPISNNSLNIAGTISVGTDIYGGDIGSKHNDESFNQMTVNKAKKSAGNALDTAIYSKDHHRRSSSGILSSTSATTANRPKWNKQKASTNLLTMVADDGQNANGKTSSAVSAQKKDAKNLLFTKSSTIEKEQVIVILLNLEFFLLLVLRITIP